MIYNNYNDGNEDVINHYDTLLAISITVVSDKQSVSTDSWDLTRPK